MATAGDCKQSCQLLRNASEEVDSVQEWDMASRQYLGIGWVAIGAWSTGLEGRQDAATEADLAPLMARGECLK